MVNLTREEWGRIKDIKELDLQQCFYCLKLNILNLGWKAFGKYYCEKEQKEHVLCPELCYRVCLSILGCKLKRERVKQAAKEQTVAVNREYYWASCYLCSKELRGAGKHGVVKNRNNPWFWGIKSVWKILCLGCIGKKFYRRMSGSKRKSFNKYVRRGYE